MFLTSTRVQTGFGLIMAKKKSTDQSASTAVPTAAAAAIPTAARRRRRTCRCVSRVGWSIEKPRGWCYRACEVTKHVVMVCFDRIWFGLSQQTARRNRQTAPPPAHSFVRRCYYEWCTSYVQAARLLLPDSGIKRCVLHPARLRRSFRRGDDIALQYVGRQPGGQSPTIWQWTQLQ